uniref:Uncharacterized protein n=1 Tax=Megaselia scalaris TaxID=36166 RepID=T1GWF4_MEGSC
MEAKPAILPTIILPTISPITRIPTTLPTKPAPCNCDRFCDPSISQQISARDLGRIATFAIQTNVNL